MLCSSLKVEKGLKILCVCIKKREYMDISSNFHGLKNHLVVFPPVHSAVSENPLILDSSFGDHHSQRKVQFVTHFVTTRHITCHETPILTKQLHSDLTIAIVFKSTMCQNYESPFYVHGRAEKLI